MVSDRISEVDQKGESLLVARNLSLRFGGASVLDDVSLAVDGEEVVGVIGPNGAGKTALVNCISGVYKPDSGQVSFAGKLISGMRPERIAKMGVARAFQHPELAIREATVLDSVLLGTHNDLGVGLITSALALPKARAADRRAKSTAVAALEALGIADSANHLVATLPYGTLKLVEIARALAMSPRLLILDEPSSGVAEADRGRVTRLLAGWASVRIAVILIEHDLEVLASVCTRVVALSRGRIVAQGQLSDVLEVPEFRDIYAAQGTERGGESAM
jgi:branched-chain amino acid transport system ATP-binding protein